MTLLCRIHAAKAFLLMIASSGRIFWGISLFLCADGGLFAQPSNLASRPLVAPFWSGKFPQRLADGAELAVINAFPNLTFEDPIGLVPEPHSTRLHVYTRQGLVYSFENSSKTSSKT